MLKRFILYGILFCSLCPAGLVAQTVMYKIELLQKILKTAKEDDNKVNTLNALGIQQCYSANYTGALATGSTALLLDCQLAINPGLPSVLVSFLLLFNGPA